MQRRYHTPGYLPPGEAKAAPIQLSSAILPTCSSNQIRRCHTNNLDTTELRASRDVSALHRGDKAKNEAHHPPTDASYYLITPAKPAAP